jgi:transcriptional regulator with XRE-family HTH domain
MIMGMARPRKEVSTDTYAGRFALRLKTLREDAGLTVAELSKKSGIPVNTLLDWESADRRPPIEKLPELAELLGVSIRSLLPKK